MVREVQAGMLRHPEDYPNARYAKAQREAKVSRALNKGIYDYGYKYRRPVRFARRRMPHDKPGEATGPEYRHHGGPSRTQRRESDRAYARDQRRQRRRRMK